MIWLRSVIQGVTEALGSCACSIVGGALWALAVVSLFGTHPTAALVSGAGVAVLIHTLLEVQSS